MQFPNPIFATPDFGAGATIAAFIVFTYLIIFLFCIILFIIGFFSRKSTDQLNKDKGLVMMVFSCVTILGSCLAPSLLFFLAHGRFPGCPDIDKIEKGMSKEEVRSLVGKPQAIHNQGSNELWTYYGDSFGLNNLYIQFDQQGKMDYIFDN